jgi:hypothetical protein
MLTYETIISYTGTSVITSLYQGNDESKARAALLWARGQVVVKSAKAILYTFQNGKFKSMEEYSE